VLARWHGKVPVAVLDVDRPTAMLMTIRINRAKGTHVAIELSGIVRALIEDWGYDRAVIADEMGATKEEVDLLAQQGVFGAKNINSWAYGKAWYPKDEP
jgi:ParB-like chromosome segregation protein Spo0J